MRLATLLLGSLLSLSYGCAKEAEAQRVEFANYDYLRTADRIYTLVAPVTSYDGGTQDITAGQHGVVAAATMRGDAGSYYNSSGGDAAFDITVTTGVVPPYPAKMYVELYDGNADDTLTCAGQVSIVGRNQFGNKVTETEAGLTETKYLTNNVYEVVESVTAKLCDTVGDTNDYLRVSVSPEIGLPQRIGSTAAIKGITYHAMGSTSVLSYGVTGSTVDLTAEAIHNVPDGGPTVANGDQVQIHMRGPYGN